MFLKPGWRSTHAVVLACVVVLGLAVLIASYGLGDRRVGSYVALGDSYTSAPGITPVVDAACGRSGRNYPHLLAARLDALLVDASCAGSGLADLKVAAVPRDAGLVSIGIGGNDLDLVGIASACLEGDCAGRLPAAIAAADALTAGLDVLLVDLRRRAPRARVVVVGYPGHAFNQAGCPDYPASAEGLMAARVVFLLLDDALRAAAARAKVDFLDLGEASRAHGICSDEPWIAGLTGSGAQPFHPLPAEQEYVASRLAALVRA